MLLLGGLLMCTPLIALVAWPEELYLYRGFVFPSIILSVTGLLMWKLLKPKSPPIVTIQEAGIVVVLSWFAVCLFSAWPFMTILKLSFTQSVFESVSGWTTTGLSVVDVTKAPHVILLWRSITQFAGGAGLAVIMLNAIAGPSGPGLSIAEGRTEQLVPQIRSSAKLVMLLYSGYAIAGIIAYLIAGMSLFDAINHTLTAVSTGGFSTYPESIAHWDSAAIEAVTISLMILGNLNFLTAYMLFNGKFKSVFRDGEVRLTALLLPLCAIILFMLVCQGLYPSLGKSVRVAIFESVSALTTTGFSTTIYNNWSPLGVFLLTVLMIIGGGTCSTAGGLKQYRIYLLCRSIQWDLRRQFLPRTAVVENYIWQGEQRDYITDERVRQVGIYLFIYITAFIIGTAILAAHGYSLSDSMFEFASSLSTVGLSVGITSPTAPSVVLWTEILGMFLGRLEFIVIYVSLIKIFRDIFLSFR
jgi:trk system potassium uptake protein TrkH